MRLTGIHLTNFRSHHDTRLDLRSVAAAVISGPTGGGKSSLLDALLWCLCGRTLGRDVVRLGCDQASVVVQFVTGGSEYRIARALSRKTARGKTDLQLAVRPDTGRAFGPAWTPLSGKSIDETEAKIREVIGLSYEAMISGPISPQDQYRRFLQPPAISIDGKQYTGPQARLQILAQMMGLEYEPLRRKALEIISGLRPKVATLEGRIAEAEGRLSGLVALKDLALDEQMVLTTVRMGLATSLSDSEEARKIVDDLSTTVARLSERLTGLVGLRRELEALTARHKVLYERHARHQLILDHKDEVRAKADEDRGLAGRLEALRGEQTEAEGRLSALQAAEAAALKAKHEREKALTKEHSDLQRGISSGKAKAESEAPLLEGKVKDHEKRSGLMFLVPCHGVQDLSERCPLLKEAREAGLALPGIRGRLLAASTWTPDPASVARVEELERLIAQGLSAPELEETVNACLTAAHEVAAIRAEVIRVEDHRKALARWVAVVPQIELAEKELPEIESDLDKVRQDSALVINRQHALMADEEALVQAKEEWQAADVRLSTASRVVTDLRAQETKAVKRVAEVEAKLQILDALADQQRADQDKLSETVSRLRTFEVLAEAYKAIPLMVIETVVIPEVEPEANRILARVSPNGMRLSLPTQRALKSKEGIADGLEIVVQDRVGERSLDDFSGGQGFLVALALRIAMTRFQAQRAGKKIETLVIDEGFGGLDPDLLSSDVVPALRVVAKEFPCLLVVSHVAGMRDCFGTRIEVAGGPEHSVATVVTT